MRIAVDAMGGDHAPRSIIDGALAAARHLDLGLLMAGPEAIIREELARHPDHQALDIRIIDAPDVVGMGESPTAALRRKSRNSRFTSNRAARRASMVVLHLSRTPLWGGCR